jgi:Ca-activated chloride channel family protein
MYAEVRVSADESSETARSPVAFVLAIDTSGSMAGQKIVDAHRSAQSILDQMNPNDMVAVVRYASDARVLVPLMPVQNARYYARQQIESLTASGNTDIANGIRVATSLVSGLGAERPRRIVLVTDGRDTSGAPRGTASSYARSGVASGITVSALGIGIDYDDAYLADLADAGRGNYEFLRDTSALDRFLAKEVREASRTTVQALRFRLDVPANVRVREVWGATYDPESHGIQMGSLFSGDERRVTVVFEVQTQEPGSWISLGGDVSWQPVGRSAVNLSIPSLRVDTVASPEEVDNARDLSVLASVASVQASRREVEAASAFEHGEQQRALQLNAENRAELDRAAAAAPAADAARLRAQKRAYDQNGSVYSTQRPAAAPARAIGAQERKNADRSYAY